MTGLDFRTVDVKFTKGQDTKTQNKLLVPGQWEQLTNMSLSDDGCPSTRNGHGQLLTAGSFGFNGLATYNDELLQIGGPLVRTVSSSAASDFSVNGKVGNIGIEKAEVYTDTAYNIGCDVAHGNGFTCYVWQSVLPANTIKATIIDESTGAKVLSNYTMSANASDSPRVVFADDSFMVFFYDISVGEIRGRVVTTAAPSSPGSIQSVTVFAQQGNFDACTFCGGTSAMVAFAVTAGAGTGSIHALQVTRTGTTMVLGAQKLIALQANIPRASINGIACVTASATVAAVFYISQAGGFAGTNGTVLDNTMTITTTQTLIDATAPPVNLPAHVVAMAYGSVGQMLVFTDQQSSFGTANFRPIRRTQVSSALAVLTGPTTILNSNCFRVNAAEASGPQGPWIAGKPFTTNGRDYLPLMVLECYALATLGANTSSANAQCSFFLADVSVGLTTAVIGHALYGTLGVYNSLGSGSPLVHTPSSTPALDADTFITAQLERRSLQTILGVDASPVGICRLKLTRNDSSGPVTEQLGQNTFIAGGALTAYDGASVTEIGFPLYPEGISVTATATGAGAVTVGTHQMCATYEWTDAAGLRHQSAPSPAVSFTFANTTDQANVIVPTLLLSQKSNILISLWMTEAGGQTFYRVVNTFGTLMLNSTAASTVSFTVGTGLGACPDATLRTGEILYSEPTRATDTLRNIIPGPCSAMVMHQNRLFVNDTTQQGKFFYSQVLVANTGLMFNPSLSGNLPVTAGDIVAFGSLDEKLILFGENRIFVMYGTGPQPDGSYSSYSEPQDVMADIGCSDARSVLDSLPGGVMFKSPKGWQMLGRDLTVRYIGEGAAAFDSCPVLSAVMLGDEQQARFLIVEDLTSPIWLVYSYLNDAWSQFQINNYAPTDGIWWPADNSGSGGYVTVSPTGGLNHDLAGVINHDNILGTPAIFTIRGLTSWLHLDAMEGFQRIRRLYMTTTAASSPSSQFVFNFGFNDNPIYVYQATGNTSSFYDDTNVEFRHLLRLQKCKSMQFLFAETPFSTSSARLSGIQAMALEVGIKRGVRKSSRNVG